MRYPNVYGIDMPTSDELVAHDRTVEEIRQIIGCDALIYQDVEGMKKAIGSLNPKLTGFDASCFDGVYVTGDITAGRHRAAQFQPTPAREEGDEDIVAPGTAQSRGLIMSARNYLMTCTCDTLAVRAAVDRSQYGENSEALYLTSGYVQPSAEAAARRFAGDEEGFTYGRYGNPTVASFEQRLAALEGTEAAISTASGMAAILMMCMGLLKAGDHVICSQSMFGSTIKLIGSDLAKFGVESSFVSQTDVGAWKAAVKANTTAAVCRDTDQPPDRGL